MWLDIGQFLIWLFLFLLFPIIKFGVMIFFGQKKNDFFWPKKIDIFGGKKRFCWQKRIDLFFGQIKFDIFWTKKTYLHFLAKSNDIVLAVFY